MPSSQPPSPSSRPGAWPCCLKNFHRLHHSGKGRSTRIAARPPDHVAGSRPPGHHLRLIGMPEGTPLTQIADLNAAFGTHFSDQEHDTVAGLVIAHLGRVPRRGETLAIGGLRFQVLRADSRRVYTLLIDKPK